MQTKRPPGRFFVAYDPVQRSACLTYASRCLSLAPSRRCMLVGEPHANTLVLVSIDGFRWDFLDFPEASQMSAIASRGTRVTKLHTVYPSKTFPAHLSIATGLYPTGHGVVDNRFCRSDRADCYRMGHGRKDPTWLAGTPLWTLVEQQGRARLDVFLA